jgi:TRAP-type C4-dicarboxylate transport system substrate-binding protein
MTRRLTPALLALGVLMAPVLSAHAQANAFANSPKITFRMSSAAPAGMEDSRAMLEAAEMLKKETNGTVVIQPFFASALFDEIAGIAAVQSGLVDMAVACTCNMTTQTSAMLFSDVPYTWKGMDNGREVWDGQIGKDVRAELTQKLGMIPVAFTPSGGGYRIFFNNQKRVKVPADVQGLKVRTTASPLEQDFWKSLGAIPTPVDVKEIYNSLQHGLVDGQHLQPVWLTLLRHDEVTKYGTEIQALAVYRNTVINAKSYAKMDAAQKAAFEKAMKFYEDKAYEWNRKLRDESMQKIKARGIEIYTPTPEEMAQWKKVGTTFAESETVKSRVPRPLLDKVVQLQK